MYNTPVSVQYILLHAHVLIVCIMCVYCRDLKASLEEAEEMMRQKKLAAAAEGGASNSPGPAKELAERREREGERAASQRSSLLAMKKAVRNGDMFTEEKNMFEEKYLVCVCVCACACVCVCDHACVCLYWDVPKRA